MSNDCSCGGFLRFERWNDVVWDECSKCGAKWDERHSPAELTYHQKTMARIRDIVAHTCDGPLTPFVHMCRVLHMVEANDITSEQGANYLAESNLLKEENEEIPSSEY
jgi:hypothetical protein